MEGLRRSTGPISSRAVQQCSKRRRGPGRLVYKSTRLLQQSLVYKSRQSLPFVCRSTLLHPTTAQGKKGWRSLPDVGEHLPPAPAAIPRLYNALRNAPFSVWWSGGWANRATRQQRAHHPNVLSQLCLKWDIPTFLLINCRTLQRDGKEMWSLLCGVHHHGV